MVVVNPQEGENGCVVSGVKMTVGVDIGDDHTCQLVDDDEYDNRTYKHHGAERE